MILTKSKVRQIIKDYTDNYLLHEDQFICNSSVEFSIAWENHTQYVRDLAIEFLAQSDKWNEYFKVSTRPYNTLFHVIAEDKRASFEEDSAVRLDFLNYLLYTVSEE